MAVLRVPESDAMLLLTCRIMEAKNTLASHLCKVEKVDFLLASFRSQYNNHSALVASFLNKVLSAIFKAGILLPRLQPEEPSFEVLVSHVTRHWRNVAISMPSLWRDIFFPPTNSQ
jgi:hypothetical protein